MSVAVHATWLDALPNMVWVASDSGQLSYANRAWLDYCGHAAPDLPAASWLDQVHSDDAVDVRSLWAAALASQSAIHIECRLRSAGGDYRWMLVRATPQPGELEQSEEALPGPAQSHWLGCLTDIDEWRQRAEAQDNTLYMHRLAGRVARLGGWTIDLPERTLTWSDENCLIHDVPPGYKPTLDEGIGYFLPEHRERVKALVAACAENGTPYEFVLPKMTAKGRQIWVRSLGEAVRDASGNVVRVQGAFQDISELKAAEARLREVELRLANTLESITDGFYMLDADWRFTYLNSPAEAMLQRSRDDLLGRSLWEEFAALLGSPLEAAFHNAVATKSTCHAELHLEPLDTWFDCRVYPTELGVAVYFQDVTQRRKEHQQLQLLETAVSRLNDMVVITEAHPFDAGGPRIVFVNDAFQRHTGYSREEAIGQTSRFLWGPRTEASEIERVRLAMEQWQAVRTEVVIYTKAGTERWIEADIAPIADRQGNFTHWVAVERDVSERKHQQGQILGLNSELAHRVALRTTELADANRELASFAHAVSHDFRSPLNTIDAFSHLLLKLDGEPLSDKARHYLARIQAGVGQMSQVIEGMLTIAHLSREELRLENIDLGPIISRIESALRARDPQRQVRVIVQEGMVARGDLRLVATVLQNLLDNAWKFTSKTEAAHIEVSSLSGEGKDEGSIVYVVSDNGAGFDMAFAHKLFGTFERLHSPGDFPGTGVGLATVKRIVERHGGRAWAEGRTGAGAQFYFTLGKREAAAPPIAGV